MTQTFSQRTSTFLPDTSMSSMVFLLYVIQFSTFLYYGVPPVGSPHYHILYYTTTGSFLQGGICKYPVQKHLLFSPAAAAQETPPAKI